MNLRWFVINHQKEHLPLLIATLSVSKTAFADSLPERIDNFTKLFDTHETAIES